MPTLSNATLTVKLVAGTSNVDITASVKVGFSPQEEALIKLFAPLAPITYSLRAEMWAEDSGFNGDDDKLSKIGSKSVAADGTHTFTKRVNRSTLDEDWEGNDEVYAKFGCTAPSNTGLSLQSATPAKSSTITGNF